MFRKLRKKARRAIVDLVAAMHDRPLPPPTKREQKLVGDLRATFQAMNRRPIEGGKCAESEWVDNAVRLEQLVACDDPRRFLRWDVIQKTMFITQAGYVAPELKQLQRRVDWHDRWERTIRESPAGHPVPYWRYPQSSGNCIQHAYHWARFEEMTGLSMNDTDFIFEFGGGYGSMCRLAYRLGFKGRYLLYDLASYSALQQFYLRLTEANLVSPESFTQGQNGILCLSDLEVLKRVLSNRGSPQNPVFVATWSLSESPLDLRKIVLDMVSSFNAFLIGYQARFSEVDNVAFFQQWCQSRCDVEWKDVLVEHLPRGSRYLMGKCRSNRSIVPLEV